jgi:hypothetical protein
LIFAIMLAAQDAGVADPAAPASVATIGTLRATEKLAGDVRGQTTRAMSAAVETCAVPPGVTFSVVTVHLFAGTVIDVVAKEFDATPIAELACVERALTGTTLAAAERSYAVSALVRVGGVAPDDPAAVAKLEREVAGPLIELHRSIERNYDRFTKRTTWTAPLAIKAGAPSAVVERMQLQAVTIFDGPTPMPASTEAALMFMFIFREWHYLKCNQTAFLVDGKPFELEPRHSGNVGSGYVTESLLYVMPPPLRSALARAKRVEFRICRDEMELDAGSVSRLGALVREIGTR